MCTYTYNIINAEQRYVYVQYSMYNQNQTHETWNSKSCTGVKCIFRKLKQRNRVGNESKSHAIIYVWRESKI